MSPSIIKNYSQLFPPHLSKPQSRLRKTILKALELAINSVMPENLMEQSIKIEGSKLIIQNNEFDLNTFEDICIIGGGKAVAHMAAYLERILSNVPNIKYKGIINIPEGLTIDDLNLTDSIQINYASHPIPNKVGMNGVRKMRELLKASSKNNLIIFLVSGGGSALLPLPRKGILLEDLQTINTLLLESGASIREINIIRKHLSNFKGGNLARMIFEINQGTLISLIISDVVGNDLDSIASGPSVPDSSTFTEVNTILKKYQLVEKVPQSIRSLVKEGLINDKLETPKARDKCFNRVYNYLIGSVQSAVEVLTNFLETKGFVADYFSDKITGEAHKFGESLFNEVFKNLDQSHLNTNRKALIGSGELTVTIKGKGIGGRNQEMLLAFLNKAFKSKISCNFCLLGANLDGIEGNSKAIGALVDNDVQNQAQKLQLNIKKYLDYNDSNSAFKLLGTEIITGPTGCNVNDLMILLCECHFEGR